MEHQYFINQERIEKVELFGYLGSIVSAKLDVDLKIEEQIRATATAFYRLRKRVFKNHDILLKTMVAVDTKLYYCQLSCMGESVGQNTSPKSGNTYGGFSESSGTT